MIICKIDLENLSFNNFILSNKNKAIKNSKKTKDVTYVQFLISCFYYYFIGAIISFLIIVFLSKYHKCRNLCEKFCVFKILKQNNPFNVFFLKIITISFIFNSIVIYELIEIFFKNFKIQSIFNLNMPINLILYIFILKNRKNIKKYLIICMVFHTIIYLGSYFFINFISKKIQFFLIIFNTIILILFFIFIIDFKFMFKIP